MQDNEMNNLIYEYLNKVKKQLPWWIKNDKKERNKILEQLETHIWDKAGDLSEYDQPTEDSVRLAIAHMGSPQNIAQEYKQGKAPKVFISAEIWSMYRRIILILVLTIIIANVLLIWIIAASYIINEEHILIDVISGNRIDLNLLRLKFIYVMILANAGFFGGIYGVTIIFFWISKHGYYPKNYQIYKQRLSKKRLLERWISKGRHISPKTGKPVRELIYFRKNYIIGILITPFWFMVYMIIFKLNNFDNGTIQTLFILFIIFTIFSIPMLIGAIIYLKHILLHQIVLIIGISVTIFIVILISITILITPDLSEFPTNLVPFLMIPFFLFIVPPAIFYRLRLLENHSVVKQLEKKK